MDKKKMSFMFGTTVVLLTHIYMLFAGLPANQIVAHSIINLVAGAALVYSWYA